MNLRAELVPYSSVVGRSVSLQAESGAVAALVMISVPNPSFPYRETAEPVAQRIVEAFSPSQKRPAAFYITGPDGPAVFLHEDMAAEVATKLGVEYHGLYLRGGAHSR
jgi:hypothetical protein